MVYISEKDCCCHDLWLAVRTKNEVPINLDNGRFPCGIECLEKDQDAEFFSSYQEYREFVPYDLAIDYCPFCGTNISVFQIECTKSWENRKHLCEAIMTYLNDVDKETKIHAFEYNQRTNKFYIHSRMGFPDNLIEIQYCIFCGEPLSETISKYDIAEDMKKVFHTDEWWKKRGL